MKLPLLPLLSLLTTLTLTLTPSSHQLQQHHINLNNPPQTRYLTLAQSKKPLILKFLAYLHTTPKYHKAFKIARIIDLFGGLRRLVGQEFYLECLGIARGIGRGVSQIVVFNYMYELGAYRDFCTSIAVQVGEQGCFLGRNLDYGYQEYLAENSVKLTYWKDGKRIFQTVGHAGLIGAHTGLRFDGYSVTLNERIQHGLHITLLQIFLHHSQTVPYTLQQTLRTCPTLQQAAHTLTTIRVAAPAYFILNAPNHNLLIEKQRNGVKGFHHNSRYLVQTNTDVGLPDPDGRRDAAQGKMEKLWELGLVGRDAVWGVLGEWPNKNQLTLITVILDTSRNVINATVWQ